MRTLHTALLLAALATGTACGKEPPTAPGGGGGALVLGTAISVSGAAGSQKFYTVVVPAGATGLRVALSGASGDADLYVRFAVAPEPVAYDCESAGFDSNEECVIASPAAGTWHIAVIGFESYSGVQLIAELTAAPTFTTLTSGVALTDQSGAEGSQRFFTITVPAGATSLTVTTSGGTGDADLYLRLSTPPTNGSFDCASGNENNTESCVVNAPAAGTWYVMLDGWEAYTGLTITATITS